MENDIEKFIQILDIVLTSEDPRIRELAQQLFTTAVLIQNSSTLKKDGPLSALFNNVSSLNERVDMIVNYISKNESKSYDLYHDNYVDALGKRYRR